jgi:hypothetical protein
MSLATIAHALRQAFRRRFRRDDLNAFDRRRTSQNGEDGIIEELARRLNVGRGFFVEFGVEDGKECNMAFASRRRGWRGIMLEGDPLKHAALAANYREFANVRCEQAFITRDNVVEIFERFAVPREFDLLSIDIDGNDYWVWERLGGYRPKIVVIEYNGTKPPPERWVMRYVPDFRWNVGESYWGASLASLEALGTRLDYALVGTDRNGVNAFFVRDDLVGGIGFPRKTASEAFHPTVYGLIPADGPFERV